MNKVVLKSSYQALISGIILVLCILVSSCDRADDPAPVSINEENTHVNSWILDNMQLWYLWENELPPSPDKSASPNAFFESLLSSKDRFSWIQENYKELLNSLQGISKEAGYEYVLYKDEGTENVLVQILYVKPGSPAESEGLQRGDVITHVNGKRMTTSNYRDVLNDFASSSFSITYKPIVADAGKFDDERTAKLSTVVFSEDPNHMSKLITVNGKKIGYYVYNFFSSGTDQDIDKYDREMDEIFASFKASGITDLVIDLRFNSGGSETSATNLASLIALGGNSSKIFFKKEYNDKIENELLNDPEAGPAALQRKLSVKAENVGSQIAGRVYILTGSRTASASELIINGLRPYMDVFLIGDVTYGKNVGSVSIYDDEDPENTWGIQPIVLKVYNSLDESDYSEGFVPNIENRDNNLFIYPLGDVREELLSIAIETISGVPATARKQRALATREIIGHSLDGKKRSFVLNVEPAR